MAEPTGGLINLGGLTQPATVLVERVSDALGGWFRPHQIKRVARAEAEAAMVKASSDIEISGLQRRAEERVAYEEVIRQRNIEQILRLALPDVSGDATPQNIEADWFAALFDRGRLVSDGDMQTLWGRILAGEANQPGTFGRRTIEMVATLEKSEARLFTTLCTFTWVVGHPDPLILNYKADIYRKADIHFGSLSHLDSIGLIRFETTGFLRSQQPKHIQVYYYGRRLALELPADSDNKLPLGAALFTAAGQQLARIAGSSPSDEVFDYVREIWEQLGYKPTEPTA